MSFVKEAWNGLHRLHLIVERDVGKIVEMDVSILARLGWRDERVDGHGGATRGSRRSSCG